MWLPYAALIPTYWNRAWPVRLPLPINPGVNASPHPYGGFGLRPMIVATDALTVRCIPFPSLDSAPECRVHIMNALSHNILLSHGRLYPSRTIGNMVLLAETAIRMNER